MLLSSNQTKDPGTLLPSVCVDMDRMSTTLANKGLDIICRADCLDKNRFFGHLDSLNNLPLDRYSVFLFYYTGHGLSEGVVLNDSGVIPYADIVTKVSASPCLQDKPKIFIFDSCRNTTYKRQPGNYSPADYVTSKNQFEFHKGIQQFRELEVRSRQEPYPPPHTLICFSATVGTPSFMDGEEGSFYTLALSHAFSQFGHYRSFPEIIAQVNASVREILHSKNQEQHPVFISTLEKQLVLTGEHKLV